MNQLGVLTEDFKGLEKTIGVTLKTKLRPGLELIQKLRQRIAVR